MVSPDASDDGFGDDSVDDTSLRQSLQPQSELSKPSTSVRKSLTQKMMTMPQPNIVVSEPNALIPKTIQVIEEPVKTGAPISFVDVAKFNGKCKDKELCGKKNGAAGADGQSRLTTSRQARSAPGRSCSISSTSCSRRKKSVTGRNCHLSS